MKTFTVNLQPANDVIFVFGSNPTGWHGAGSAAVAVKLFGAVYGKGEGLQGNSYALPTTELRKEYQVKGYNQSIPAPKIIESIKKMYACAKEHPDKKFCIAYRSQVDEVTLCGYSGGQLMSMFKEAAGEEGYPENVWFSEEWTNNGIYEL